MSDVAKVPSISTASSGAVKYFKIQVRGWTDFDPLDKKLPEIADAIERGGGFLTAIEVLDTKDDLSTISDNVGGKVSKIFWLRAEFYGVSVNFQLHWSKTSGQRWMRLRKRRRSRRDHKIPSLPLNGPAKSGSRRHLFFEKHALGVRCVSQAPLI